MLMTKFTYEVTVDENGYLHSTVTRLADGAQKKFFQCMGTKEGLERLFESITDDLAEGYWPRERTKEKKKKEEISVLDPAKKTS